MDERRFNNDENQPKRPSQSFDSYYSGRSSRVSNFKVKINDFGDTPAYKPEAPQKSAQPQRPAQNPTKPVTQKPVQRPTVPTQNKQSKPAQTSPKKTADTSRKAPSKPTAQKKTSPKAAESKKSEAPSKQPMTKGQSYLQHSRAKAAREKAIKKKRFMKGAIITCVCIISIALFTTILSTVALSTINDILALKKVEGDSISVVIPDNADFDQVFDILSDSGLVKQKHITKFFCKFRHYDGYYSEVQEKYIPVKYEAGVYYLDQGTGIETMLEILKGSVNPSKDIVRLTFPEGWKIAQIFEKIEKYKVCEAEKLYSNLDIIGKQFKFFDGIHADSSRYLKTEGYIFPDTYDFYIGESASSVLKKLFSNYQKKWTSEFSKKAKAFGMTQDEIITLASIIQREAKDASQMADVSSVLHNRLNKSATYPQLQLNSTMEYITSLNKYNLFNESTYSMYLEAYNTYNSEGLPPGPICNPGIDAIEAALNPSDTNYYFFCHDANGKLYLAETAAEHQKNAAIALAD